MHYKGKDAYQVKLMRICVSSVVNKRGRVETSGLTGMQIVGDGPRLGLAYSIG